MNASRWLLLIAGALLIVLSIFMFTTPGTNIVELAIFIGIVMLVDGVAGIYHWFAHKLMRSGWELMGGILSVLLGAWVLFGPRAQASLAVALPFMFTAWVLVSGIMRTIGSFEMKDRGVRSWGWVLALGIIGILLGFILMYHPLIAAVTLGTLIPCLFLYEGITSVAMALTVRE